MMNGCREMHSSGSAFLTHPKNSLNAISCPCYCQGNVFPKKAETSGCRFKSFCFSCFLVCSARSNKVASSASVYCPSLSTLIMSDCKAMNFVNPSARLYGPGTHLSTALRPSRSSRSCPSKVAFKAAKSSAKMRSLANPFSADKWSYMLRQSVPTTNWVPRVCISHFR